MRGILNSSQVHLTWAEGTKAPQGRVDLIFDSKHAGCSGGCEKTGCWVAPETLTRAASRCSEMISQASCSCSRGWPWTCVTVFGRMVGAGGGEAEGASLRCVHA